MSTFEYRRKLSAGELMPAVGAALGAAVAVGSVVFYLGRIMLQRTPLQGARPPLANAPDRVPGKT